MPYNYVNGMAMTGVDPSGMKCGGCKLPSPPPSKSVNFDIPFPVPTRFGGPLRWFPPLYSPPFPPLPLQIAWGRFSGTATYFVKNDYDCCQQRHCVKENSKLHLPASVILDEALKKICGLFGAAKVCSKVCTPLAADPPAYLVCVTLCAIAADSALNLGEICKNKCRKADGSRCFKSFMQSCTPARAPLPGADLLPECAYIGAISNTVCC